MASPSNRTWRPLFWSRSTRRRSFAPGVKRPVLPRWLASSAISAWPPSTAADWFHACSSRYPRLGQRGAEGGCLVDFYPWVVFIHVAAAFLFVMGHGASMWTSDQIRRERDPVRIRALLELSS